MTDETLSMLANSADAFARPDAKRVRGLRSTEAGFDRDVWRSIAGQGWLSILVPEEMDGLGLGMAAAAVIAQRLGYALFPEPFVASGIMATRCLASGDNAALRHRVLPELMAGETIAALAWQDESGGLALDATGVTASPAGEAVTLDGISRFVPVASADAFIVAARGADGLALYWVVRDAPGLACVPERCADGSASARLTLSNLRLPSAACVASPPRAEECLRLAIDAALAGASAELVGIMNRVLELTLEYLRTRKQFGRAIGSFQALQHRAVDVWIQKELARAAVAAAVRALDDPAVGARAQSAAASGAKARAAEAALALCKEALQMHGAIGYTDEYDLGLYFNRALTLSAWLGNAADRRRRYGELAGEAAA